MDITEMHSDHHLISNHPSLLYLIPELGYVDLV